MSSPKLLKALFASTLFAVSLTTQAELPEWLPSAIQLPVPHEIVMDQALGTRTHILQIQLPSDPAPHFADWGSALTEQGYTVDESMLFDGRLLFSGKDIESGQIAILPSDQGEFILQVDVSRLTP
ncbi:hypothetical protein [Thiocapsa rosea]|uniref:Uncharacterized protein n=1 Tax=Thiocapsa rosea TaxID=69360 RepID=A0A495V2B0_9GAMM|nr:hypothetical protein [Thiocapsa rosea]RKT42723.1 hypothetical protein BDD21_0012 [Thiocapsa rosea]